MAHMRRSGWIAWGCLLACCVSGCGAGAPTGRAAREDLSFSTSDGVTIHATLYRPAAVNPPAVILLHRAGADRHSWKPMAERLCAEGYMAIAIDLRGHGRSRSAGDASLSFRHFSDQDWQRALLDAAGAKDALTRAGADPNNLAIAGESIGANLALRYAMQDPAMQAVAAISPGLDYHGVKTADAMVALQERPVLLMAAEGDAYAAQSAAALKAASEGYCEWRSYPGAAHGTDLFAVSLQAMEQFVEWFSPIIGPRRAASDHGAPALTTP